MWGACKQKWCCAEANGCFILLIFFPSLPLYLTSSFSQNKFPSLPQPRHSLESGQRRKGERWDFHPDLLFQWTKSGSALLVCCPILILSHYSLHFWKKSPKLLKKLLWHFFVFPIQHKEKRRREKKLNPEEVKLQTEMCSSRYEGKNIPHWLPGNLSTVQYQNIKVITKAQTSHRLSLEARPASPYLGNLSR